MTIELPRIADRSSEAILRALVDSSYDVVGHQVGGVWAWISPSVTDLLGWPVEMFIGRSTRDLWHPDDLAAALEMRERALSGVPASAVLRIRHRDGHHLRLDVAVRPDRPGDHATGMLVSLRDPTLRADAEEAVGRSERDYRLLAENASDMVFRSSADGVLHWVSPSVSAVLGWEPSEMLHQPIRSFIADEDLGAMAAAAAVIAQGSSVTYEARFRCKDGSYRWLSSTSRPIFDDHGQIIARIGGARDIDVEVAARAELSASEHLFRSTMDASPIGMAIVDTAGIVRHANPAICSMLGREASALVGRPASDFVHPDDRDTNRTIRDTLTTGQVDEIRGEYRLIDATGGAVWVSRVGVLIRDADGLPDFVVVQLQDITSDKLAHERLLHLAYNDELTGLPNRAWILERLAEALSDGGDSAAGRIGVLFVDINDLKLVNDSLGHAAGDQVLCEVARRLGDALGGRHVLARFGGDEFVAVVAGVADDDELVSIAESITSDVACDVLVSGHHLVPTVSIGISVSTAASDPHSLLRDADTARVRAKQNGRSNWHVFAHEMHGQVVERLMLEGELHAATDARQFVVFLQPIVSLADERVLGHEALIRWNHPERGLLTPAAFLSVAEDTGLIVPIGAQVLDDVCARLASTPVGHVAVNVSGVELATRTWARDTLAAIDRHAIDPRRLVIEVTETAALRISTESRAGLDALRALGVGIHVDDFGTGFSSISLLRDLPVSGVKLDRRFVDDLTSGPSAANALALGVAGLVNGLGLVSIAEGIETPAQGQLVREMGWRFAQGYLFGRPARAADAAPLGVLSPLRLPPAPSIG